MPTATRASVELAFDNVGPSGGASAQLSSSGSTVNGRIGQMRFDAQNQSGSPELGSLVSPTADGLVAFCIELGQNVSSGWSVFETSDIASATTTHKHGAAQTTIGGARGSALDLLADNFWAAATGGSLLDAAAFQLSVWEIVHESPDLVAGNPLADSLSVSQGDGTFFVSSQTPSSLLQSAIAQANAWLSEISAYFDQDLNTVSTLTPNDALSLVALNNPTLQNQITQYQTPEEEDLIASNPEPVSAVVWAGLLGLCGLRRSPRK